MIDNNIIFGTVFIIVATTISYLKIKKNQNLKKLKEQETELVDLENNIRKNLNKLEITFHKEAINYYLPTLLLDSSFSREERKLFLTDFKHKKVVSLERIDWSDFKITGIEGNLLEEILKEKIKDFNDKDDYTIKDAFKFMLLKRAKEETQKIIKEKEKDV